jgi:indolepyruvate ferredoxin oxidoreductase beta subunit
MNAKILQKDPLNLVISGRGGQGNVVISLILGNALVKEGYLVMLGQSFAGIQRGGSVRNFLRVSKEILYGPISPQHKADIIIGMELTQTILDLREFGNPYVVTIANRNAAVSPGRTDKSSDVDKALENIKELSGKTLLIYATDDAEKMGNPILANIILTGALVGTGLLPLRKESVEAELRERFPRAIDINLKAFNRGVELAAEE